MSIKQSRVRWGLLAVALLCQVASVAAEDGKSGETNGYAGDARCIDCHSEKAVVGPHTKNTTNNIIVAQQDVKLVTGAHSGAVNPTDPSAINSCEACHGPGLEHAKFQEDSDDKDAVDPTLTALRLALQSSSTAGQRSAMCLQCHTGGNEALWDGSTHERRDVSCTDCHSPHAKNPKYLRAATQTEVCATCHKDVNAELQRNSHHPIREGKMQCSDCHNSHGTVADKLITANFVNEKCYECHAEKRGPFLWDHAPVQENCMACHTPHGSSHESLLTQKVPFLCQSCHSEAGHPGTLNSIPSTATSRSPFVVLQNRAFNRACMNCHVAVHGSNSPSGKSLAR